LYNILVFWLDETNLSSETGSKLLIISFWITGFYYSEDVRPIKNNRLDWFIFFSFLSPQNKSEALNFDPMETLGITEDSDPHCNWSLEFAWFDLSCRFWKNGVWSLIPIHFANGDWFIWFDQIIIVLRPIVQLIIEEEFITIIINIPVVWMKLNLN
jgi:hypothetical protein